MTTVKFGWSPGAWVAGTSGGGGSIFDKGWFSDAVGAGGWVISNIIGRPRQPKTVEEFMKGNVAGPTPGGAYLPLILAGGVALIVVVALLRR